MKTWRCQREGSCCTRPGAVVMKPSELDALLAHPAAASRHIVYEFSEDKSFVALRAGPCPFYEHATGECSIYEVRPYNCRRFQCGRWDTEEEKFLFDPMVIIRKDNDLRWSYRTNQKAHEQWALEHGWAKE